MKVYGPELHFMLEYVPLWYCCERVDRFLIESCWRFKRFYVVGNIPRPRHLNVFVPYERIWIDVREDFQNQEELV